MRHLRENYESRNTSRVLAIMRVGTSGNASELYSVGPCSILGRDTDSLVWDFCGFS
jgi:hypothetical protein